MPLFNPPPSSGAGSGTVTSVGLSTPGLLDTVSGSPVTAAGTLALALKVQAANKILAGPSTGADAVPTMRALVAGDVGAVNPSTLTGTGTVPTAGLPAATTSAQGAVQLDTATPLSATAAGTSGSSTKALPSDHAHPLPCGLWIPADHGLLAWACDPFLVGDSRTPGSATLYLVRLRTPVALSVTNVIVGVRTAGSVLTNCYLGLYTTGGTLVGTTANQSSVWTTAGIYTTALTGGPFAVAAGSFFVGIQVGSASTGPQIYAGGNLGSPFATLLNLGVSAGTGRAMGIATGDAALGNVTIASTSAQSNNFWFAVS